MTLASPARRAYALAIVVFVLDQALKLWALFVFDLAAKGRVAVAPLFDLVLVWNTGVSYGLLQQDSDFGRWALVALHVVASIAITIWIAREKDALSAWALALILGGAVGNGVDRVAYGAVVDYALLHWGEVTWYVFNLADAAIVAGVLLLLYGALRGSKGATGVTS
ncbi:signal peptidase II [Methylopila capsulata]|uniref:Lipoprotein signal peptidase n=1 Tax=Methylopila capsulata TaxID=61654 RepID=A0A9W6IX39_9HYPH|nr:signal peptidase II [Methylopila capsulata]MBM7852552.1 signal peptidase II [Methylopila capsulata]GLK56760.1 lipoprotein signal peptidase [Methylopila capsulata]